MVSASSSHFRWSIACPILLFTKPPWSFHVPYFPSDCHTLLPFYDSLFLTGLGMLLIALACVVIVRTVRLSYDLPDIGPTERHDFDAEAAVERLSRGVQFQTVSFQDPTDLDADAFEGFISFFEEAYPRLHETLDRERVGDHTLLYRWDGANPKHRP